MRLVFVTLEYDASTFSGNGIYAQSQVRGLLSCGHDVLIVCGQPSTTTTAPGASDKSTARVLRLGVDAERWGTLDRHSAWESFAREAAGSCVTTAVAEFQPHCVLAVDWSGVAAYEAMRTAAASDALATTKLVYLVYRVFSANLNSDADESGDRAWHSARERHACAIADATVALCRHDAHGALAVFSTAESKPAAHVLLPSLRSPLREIALAARASSAAPEADDADDARSTLLCCVRLSPEKNAGCFVELIETLHARGALVRHGITPVIVSNTQSDYAADLRTRARAVGAVLVETFQNAGEMAAHFQRALLNVHTSLNEAFGMTIIEAAAFEVPSLVNHVAEPGPVGATDLLLKLGGGASGATRRTRATFFAQELNCGVEVVADAVEALLADRATLRRVGVAAADAALEWDETKNAEWLAENVLSAL
jgi:hypothetical protein